jgi:protoheme IX farnesyltransferase
MHAQPTTTVDLRRLVHDYFELTKPRVTLLAAFCALIGMLLASDDWVPWRVLVFGLGGISLLAGSGFTFNCLVERSIDARMARTRARASARGEVSMHAGIASSFAGVLGGLGAWMLYAFVNPLTMWLTLATFVGYAVIYTVDPQARHAAEHRDRRRVRVRCRRSSAGRRSPTRSPRRRSSCSSSSSSGRPRTSGPSRFYRVEDYRKSGLPMLPVTHGSEFTRLNILLYTLLLVATTVLPYLIGMSGVFYLLAALVLGGVVPRLCVVSVARLLRRPGAQDLRLLHLLSGGAVRRPAGRPLSLSVSTT